MNICYYMFALIASLLITKSYTMERQAHWFAADRQRLRETRAEPTLFDRCIVHAMVGYCEGMGAGILTKKKNTIDPVGVLLALATYPALQCRYGCPDLDYRKKMAVTGLMHMGGYFAGIYMVMHADHYISPDPVAEVWKYK
jgi:hypothetical protein